MRWLPWTMGLFIKALREPNWSCSEDIPGMVTCSYTGSLSVNASTSVNLTVKVSAGQTASLSSTAEVSGTETDGNAGNDGATANTNVNRSADVGIALVAAPSPVIAGTDLVYTQTVTNHGPSTATGIATTLTLDAGAGYLSFSGSNWSCSEGTPGVVNCSYTGALNVNASSAVMVTVHVSADQIDPLSSTAEVGGSEPDSNSANDSATANTNINHYADMGITLSGAPDPVTAGTVLIYTLSVDNSGPSTASGIAAVVTLDSGVSYQSASGLNWTCDEATPGSVSCSYTGTLDVSASAAVDISVKVSPSLTSSVSTSASVSAVEVDTNSANDSADANSAIARSADVALAISDQPDAVIAGSSLVYTLTATNNGPSTATGVETTLTLDLGLSYQGYSGIGWTCAELPVGTVTCTRSGALDVPGSEAVDVTVSVDPTRSGMINSSGTLSAVEDDQVAGNNLAAATTTVDRVADLSLTITDTPDPVVVGADITYTIAVHNAGPSSAEGSLISAILPAGVVFKSYSSADWICDQNAGTLSCDPMDLSSGYNGTVDVVVTAPSEPVTLEITGSVSATTTDGNLDDNSVSEFTAATPSVDLSVQFISGDEMAVAGHQHQYTLKVENHGLSTASAVTMLVELPAGSEFVSALGSGWICNYAAGEVTCTLDELIVSVANSVTIVVRAPSSGSVLVANASVLSAYGDPVMDNNAVQLTTPLSYSQYLPVVTFNQ